MSREEDFSTRPFAAGSLTGLRSFRVTPKGVLTGCARREPWAPGVNEAKCVPDAMQALSNAIGVSMAQAMYSMSVSMAHLTAQMTGKPIPVSLTKKPRPPTTPAPPVHEVGQLNCSCGFYAYFDTGSNPHHEATNYLGVIQGYGIATVGSRGFRCSKARILALIEQVDDPGFSSVQCDCMACRLNRSYAMPRVAQDIVAAQYPDVPWFETIDAALREFPLTPQEQPIQPEPLYDTRHTFIPSAWLSYYGQPVPPPLPTAGPETPPERAMRLRRERNTGPAQQTGLDGRRRQG